jgi:membrane-bound metal-dependent hydrolase YbcI (DUF457 family)
MFVGHYSAALAAKAAEPRAPLWGYVIGAQFLDVGWASFIMIGLERAKLDESLPGSPLVLYRMPYTHSLPAAIAWSVLAGVVTKYALKAPRRVGVAMGLVVFSHWVLDLVAHRPDLKLWWRGPMIGMGLWDYPVAEQAVEIGLLAVAGVFWTAWRIRNGRRAWPAAAFMTFLVALQIVALSAPEGGSRIQMGLVTLAAYAVAALVAWLVERGPVDAAERLQGAAAKA